MLRGELRVGPWRKTALLAALLVACLFFYASRPLPDHLDAGRAKAPRSPPQLSSALFPVGSNRFVRSLQGGPHSAFEFVLVHGGDRVRQNAEYWQPHFAFFTEHGWMQALDLLGHGDAKPGAADDAADVTQADQEAALAAVLAAPPAGHAKRVVVARSWGAAVLYGALATLPADAPVHAVVLIAPAVNPRTFAPVAWAAGLPTLIVWAHEDSTVPYVRARHVEKAFSKARLVTFRGVPAEPPSRAHMPEMERPEAFQAEVFALLTDLAAQARQFDWTTRAPDQHSP